MKSFAKYIYLLLFGLHALPLFFAGLSIAIELCGGLGFYLSDGYSSIYAAVVLLSTLLCVILRPVPPYKLRLLRALLTPAAFFHSLIALGGDAWCFEICIAAAFLSLFVPAGGKRHAPRIFSDTAFALLCAIFLLANAFPIGQTTLVRTLASPDERHVALLYDIDQGALGGDTCINIRKTPLHLPFGTLTAGHIRYYLDWIGAEKLRDCRFEWLDNESLHFCDERFHVP